MKRAIFPGSFDPLTLGHVDIIQRAAQLFDEVIVVILENSEKYSLFSLEQRMFFIQESIKEFHNVRCDASRGLTVAYATQNDACAIIRGVRSVKDYEYELEIASANHFLNPQIETVLLFSSPQYAYVSSSIIRECIKYKQNLQGLVSDAVLAAIDKE